MQLRWISIPLTLLACAPLPLALAFANPKRFFASSKTVAPLYTPSGSVRLLEDAYIVVLKDDVKPRVFDAHLNVLMEASVAMPLHAADAGGPDKVFRSDIVKGYTGKFSKEVVEMIRSMPEVAYVERDQIMRVAATQEKAPWGLARISHREPLDKEKPFTYEYVENGGEGVMVYVIDSGIYLEHEDFEGRARWGATIIKGEPDVDEFGHGTHVSGIIASRRFGVAKRANLTAVKVVDNNGNGNLGLFIEAALWSAFDAQKLAEAAAAEVKANGSTKYKGAVINMSLSGAHSEVSEQVLNRIVEFGIPIVAAAGNDVSSACTRSPGSAEKVITVGAATINERRMCDTNHGKCVDIFAPGQDVLSTWVEGPRSSAEASGTSMAAPHVSGLLAYLLSIYPHKTFNPDLGGVPTVPVPEKKTQFSRLLGAYAVAYEALPAFLTPVMPHPFSFKEETQALKSSPKALTPDELKKALFMLSTEGKLAPESLYEAPNRLVFNNATDPGGNSWIDDEFWASL